MQDVNLEKAKVALEEAHLEDENLKTAISYILDSLNAAHKDIEELSNKIDGLRR